MVVHGDKPLLSKGLRWLAMLIMVLAVVLVLFLRIWPRYKISSNGLSTTKASIKSMYSAVMQFHSDTGRYPTEAEGLRALVVRPPDVTKWLVGGYLETSSVPKDEWGKDFIYERLAEPNEPFRITSLGADHKKGGEGYDSDVSTSDPH